MNYGDFLAAVAPFNRASLDRWIVVTRPSDEETRAVCKRYDIETLLTDEGAAPFCKGWLIERGLQMQSADAWRLHIDADIALPLDTRTRLSAAALDESCIYGCDRVMLRSKGEWETCIPWLIAQHDYHNRLRVPFRIGTRWVGRDTGYVPIGFFQLWHGRADIAGGVRIRPYPVKHNNACRTDVQHALQWDRAKRLLLPDILVAHIESEPAPLGANWNGRTTKKFSSPQIGELLNGQHHES